MGDFWNSLTEDKVTEILETYDWIKVDSFKDDKSLPAEDRLAILKKHHHEEADFLIDYVRGIVKEMGEMKRNMSAALK